MPDSPSAPLLSTVAGTTVHEIEVKRSRFLCRLSHADGLAVAEATIAEVRKQHWDARHHCTALVLGATGQQQRSSDDGEPSGTAGVPMLEVLRHHGLTDVVAVVTRYFGGTLLGAGGLVRAYTAAVSETAALAPLVRREPRDPVTVAAPLAEAGRVDHALRAWANAHDAVVTDVRYDADGAVVTLLVPPPHTAGLRSHLAGLSGGALTAAVGERRVVDLP